MLWNVMRPTPLLGELVSTRSVDWVRAFLFRLLNTSYCTENISRADSRLNYEAFASCCLMKRKRSKENLEPQMTGKPVIPH